MTLDTELPRHTDRVPCGPVVACTPTRGGAGMAGSSGVPGPLWPDDWDLLFNAVIHRLTQTGTGLGMSQAAAGLGVHTTVRECVQALQVLHAALGRERAAQRWAERALRERG